MYPSREDPSYGIFVKNIKEVLQGGRVDVPHQAVIVGRNRGVLQKTAKYIKLYWDIVAKGLSKDFDIIYAHFITHTLVPSVFIKSIRGKRFVANVHGSDILEGQFCTGLLRKIGFFLFKKVDLFIVPSRYFARVIIEKYGVEEKKIYVSPSGGVDNNLFFPTDKSRVKAKFDLSREEFVLGYVSRIDQGKGWDVLLKALDVLRRENIQYKCMVAGAGEQVKEFLQSVEELCLKDKIIYLGEQEHEKLPDIYNCFDILVFPTRLSESLGLVGIESIMCGVPVIASRIGGIEEYIHDSKNGFLFTPGDHSELYSRIIQFMSLNAIEKRQMRSNCLSSAKRFKRSVVAEGLRDKMVRILW